ncbi:Rap/ran-GAP family protein [Trichomonas vaginalis G3]|uniref:Rap/ran-GAP family protein n=1 Tax=Trichomonas vaginalis (strain ATCC PRA-98 / G3) TaxID=412133 RepID=A2FTL6_TRIV3|nr:GTPase activator protein [Trichomonas vaginalis G3]EAX91750.1 Rap/ran-GAP family protein [Trichomonas vaginalis G3]KAI5550801.1 GTPase activator protein [Trichomonas vaginalis G3]|eukprot:XP_001304680.1 Rap/ran-GAP family protein [Trichomonas vaginalis G3]
MNDWKDLIDEIQEEANIQKNTDKLTQLMKELISRFSGLGNSPIEQSNFEKLLNFFRLMNQYSEKDYYMQVNTFEILIHSMNTFSITTDPKLWVDLFQYYVNVIQDSDKKLLQVLNSSTNTFYLFWYSILRISNLDQKLKLSLEKVTTSLCQTNITNNYLKIWSKSSYLHPIFIQTEDLKLQSIIIDSLIFSIFRIETTMVDDPIEPITYSSYNTRFINSEAEKYTYDLLNSISNEITSIKFLINIIFFQINKFKNEFLVSKGSININVVTLMSIIDIIVKYYTEKKISIYPLIIEKLNEIPEFKNSCFVQLFTISIYYHSNAICYLNMKNFEPKFLQIFAELLSIVYCKYFMKLNKDNLCDVAKSCKATIKRTGLAGFKAEFRSNLDLIYDRPVEFYRRIFDPTLICTCPELRMVTEDYQEIFKIFEYIVTNFPGKKEELVYRIVNINVLLHTHIVEVVNITDNAQIIQKYFPSEFTAVNFIPVYKTAISIVGLNAPIEEKSQKIFIDMTLFAFRSDNPEIVCIGIEGSILAFSRMINKSFCLIEPIISACEQFEPDPRKTLQVLMSCYGIATRNNMENQETIKEKIIQIIEKIFAKIPKDNIAVGSLITLVTLNSRKSDGCFSEDLKNLIRTFFSGDIKFSMNSLRLFSFFSEYFNVIRSKFPEFPDIFGNILKEILIKRDDLSKNIFNTLVDVLIDITVQTEDSKFLDEVCNFHKDNKTVIQKRSELNFYKNSDLIESNYNYKSDLVVITNNETLHKLKNEGNELTILTKTYFSKSSHKVIMPKAEKSKIPKYDKEKTEVPPAETINSEFSQSIGTLVDDIISKNQLKEYKFEDFSNSFTQQTSNPSSPRMRLEHRPSMELFHTNDPTTSLFMALFGDNYITTKPSNLIDIAVDRVFSISPRENIKVGLIFVNGLQKQNEIFSTEWKDTSSAFKSFVLSLGEVVDLKDFSGFQGKLDTANFSNGRYHIYYGTPRFELFYHTAPLMPIDPTDKQQIYKKRHIGNDNLHVVWAENTFDYDTSTITSQFNDAHIIVFPLENSNFFRVSVKLKKQIEYEVGPLFDDIILPPDSLPSLVQWTTILTDRMVRDGMSDSSPHEVFDDDVSKLIKMAKSN